jgi:hypothetical protein
MVMITSWDHGQIVLLQSCLLPCSSCSLAGRREVSEREKEEGRGEKGSEKENREKVLWV